MSLGRLFRMMYWSIRKDWRVLPHLVIVLTGWLANLVRLRLGDLAGRGSVFIGLVEQLGDVVAAEPVSRLAKRLARKPYASIPAGFAAVDSVVTVTCLTEWLLLQAAGVGDCAWDLHINQRYCPRCNIPVLKTGRAAAISTENYYHSGNVLAVECLSAGIPVLTDGPELQIDGEAAAYVDRLDLPERYIAIHCASTEASRDWPHENWRHLVSQLVMEPGLAVVEVGIQAVVVSRDDAMHRNLCGKLSIPQTAEVLRRAALFIGIDSGPAHLANAVGVPGVILLCLYKGFVDYMPFSGGYSNGDSATIVRTKGPMNSLSVAPVIAAVRERLEAPNRGSNGSLPK
jgi:heptosyltransferase-3